MNKLLMLTALCPLLSLGSVAFAEEIATSSAATESDDYESIKLRVPWTGDAGASFGLAYEQGSWGGEWIQGVRLHVPFGRHFGMNVRGLMLGELKVERWDFGGRVDLVGQSPVFLNLVRLYGGGGIQVFRPVSGIPSADRKTSWGGGGHFGFEFFMAEWMSWILEIGGNSGAQNALGSGATIIAGVNFYPF